MMQTEEEYFLESFLLGAAKYMSQKYTYEPLKITFYLSTPIALNHPWMHFDGLIAHLMLMQALDRDWFLLPRKFPFGRLLKGLNHKSPPIKQINSLYHASASILDCDNYYLETIYKRFEDRWSPKKVKKIIRGSGYYKDYAIQHLYIPAKSVTFFVFGAYEKLKELCDLVVGLGDNIRIGYGSVRSFIIEKIPEDYSLTMNGIAMRPIPIERLEYTQEKVYVAWKPPYWASESIAECAPPGSKVILKNG